MASRLAPIASKAAPVSRADSMMAKRPIPNRYAARIKSPVKARGEVAPPRGSRAMAHRVVARDMAGPQAKIQVVVRLMTSPLGMSLARS